MLYSVRLLFLILYRIDDLLRIADSGFNANENHNGLTEYPWDIPLLTSIGLAYIIFSAVLN